MKKKMIGISNAIAFFVWVLAGSALDSGLLLPFVAYVAATIWLWRFLIYGEAPEGGDYNAVD